METRTQTRSNSHWPIVAVVLAAGLAIGCSSPTAPQGTPMMTALRLTGAYVMVGSEIVNGQTMQAGHMPGGSTLFEATLRGPDGSPAPGQTVQVQYQTPSGGMGSMMGGQGILHLYDDGTHGDRVAGDGIYCYEDGPGQYGPHMQNAPHGQYHYEFYGFDHDEHHSNHVNVVVTIASG